MDKFSLSEKEMDKFSLSEKESIISTIRKAWSHSSGTLFHPLTFHIWTCVYVNIALMAIQTPGVISQGSVYACMTIDESVCDQSKGSMTLVYKYMITQSKYLGLWATGTTE